ncbi:prepilin-type N-terminal cleavage/methylation domain-containing protein [Candidatus Omnitrophota bacterium]
MLKKGFTLLEVLIVVIIIGVLAAIALPQYVNTIEKARSAEATGHIGALRSSMDRYWYEQGALASSYAAASWANLDVDNPNNDSGRLFNYTLTDTGTMATKAYTIRAERIGKTSTHWVQWTQTDNNTGRLYKSDELGGPES